jgi:hypothetical protein
MPRPQSIDDIVGNAISKAMLKIVPAIQRQVAVMAAEELERNLAIRDGELRRRRSSRRSRPRHVDIARWVADRNARRVPNFVIEMTNGLDTKKKIVARYGENVTFEKGKPAPKPVK